MWNPSQSWLGLPMMACLMLEWMGRMFLWISSMGPGRWEILSFKSSASRALFSCSCLAWSDGSADVSGCRQKNKQWTFLRGCSEVICHTPDRWEALCGTHPRGYAFWSARIAQADSWSSSWDSPQSGKRDWHVYHFSISHSVANISSAKDVSSSQLFSSADITFCASWYTV